ncbi:ATP-dependent protease ATPase subunit HslU [bacterium]|nr:ATP-dependent protease ATPase subunit HslU [bacterium]
MFELTPKKIVKELDKYIVGQDAAKKSVAIALRNRWRRQQVKGKLKEEIMPNNILMIGPTGVGKTEIARRLSNLANAPFVKVEASKFTEVGYVGRDVESMVRELVNISVSMVKAEKAIEVQEKAEKLVFERLLDYLLPRPPRRRKKDQNTNFDIEKWQRSREKIRQKLKDKKLENHIIEIETRYSQSPTIEIFSPMGMEEMGINFQEMLEGAFPIQKKRRKLTVEEARKVLLQEETAKLVDLDEVVDIAIQRVENNGIIIIDEIDKIVEIKETRTAGVSREGVQRDLLPIIEGSNVMTKYGMVKTDHILFIAAGAFHIAKPSDLIPELQGRLPIRVELDNLGKGEFEKILVEPENALIKQYKALLKSEGVELKFTKTAIQEIARIADEVNTATENIGARRLQTVMTALLEDIMYELPNKQKKSTIVINKKNVQQKLAKIVEDRNLSRYIL